MNNFDRKYCRYFPTRKRREDDILGKRKRKAMAEPKCAEDQAWLEWSILAGSPVKLRKSRVKRDLGGLWEPGQGGSDD